MSWSPALDTRLAELMRARGLSGRALAVKAGLPEGAVRDIRRGRSQQPRPRTLRALADALGVTVEELVGQAPPPATEPAAVPAAPPAAVRAVPEYDVRAAAGAGAYEPPLGPDNRPPVLAEWRLPAEMLAAQVPHGARLAIVRVQGDSMEPDYPAGGRVLLDVADRTPSPPGVFVLWDGFGLVLKQLEVLPGAPPRSLRVSSINPRYISYDAPLEEVHISGRVVGRWVWT